MIELTLPYPPSANRLWTRTRRGMRKTDTYTQWLDDAGKLARPQLRAQVIVGPYKIAIAAVRPDKRRRDLDNLIKPIGDLMQHIGAIGDDCNCEMVTARWVTTGSPLTVRLEPAGVE
jgi:crossover junction endodeoxyribonuclease RusA